MKRTIELMKGPIKRQRHDSLGSKKRTSIEHELFINILKRPLSWHICIYTEHKKDYTV